MKNKLLSTAILSVLIIGHCGAMEEPTKKSVEMEEKIENPIDPIEIINSKITRTEDGRRMILTRSLHPGNMKIINTGETKSIIDLFCVAHDSFVIPLNESQTKQLQYIYFPKDALIRSCKRKPLGKRLPLGRIKEDVYLVIGRYNIESKTINFNPKDLKSINKKEELYALVEYTKEELGIEDEEKGEEKVQPSATEKD